MRKPSRKSRLPLLSSCTHHAPRSALLGGPVSLGSRSVPALHQHIPVPLAARPPGAALPGSLRAFSSSFCLLPPQAPWTQRSPRLPDICSKERHRQQRWTVSPQKDTEMFIGIVKKPEEELKFLVYFQDEEIMEKTEMINERFSAQCPTNKPCSVEIQSTELGDSALYFCASSQSTVLKVRFPSNTNSACTQLRK